jgi:hypothetical protein
MILANHNVSKDANFASVVLGINPGGADGSVSFVDFSNFRRTVSAVSNAQKDTAQTRYGSASILLDGTDDYLSCTNSTDFDFGSGDFTIEMPFRFAAGAAGVFKALVTNRQDTGSDEGFLLYKTAADKIGLICWGPTAGTVFVNLTGTTTLVHSTWYDCVARRTGTSFTVHVDQNLEASTTSSTAIVAATDPLYIGRDPSNVARYWNGWIGGLRITKGFSRPLAAMTFPFSSPGPR